MCVLYDSVCTLCPLEEREIWKLAHRVFMYLGNGWAYHGRVLRYPIETELNKRWSFKPSKAEEAAFDAAGLLDTTEATEAIKWLVRWETFMEKNEVASCVGMDAALDELEIQKQNQGQDNE